MLYTLCLGPVAEKQHYVPEVYLKHFTRKGQFFSSTPKLEHYNKPKKKYPSQVCYLPDFYEFTKANENSLKRLIESKAFAYENKDLANTFSIIDRKSAFISRSNYKKLIHIYLSLKHRNLYMRNLFLNYESTESLDQLINEYRPFRDTIEHLAKKPFDEFMGQIKKSILEDPYFGELAHHQAILRHASGTNEPVNDARKVLTKLRIHVFEPLNKDDFFVTSDNPGFTIVDKNKVFNTNYGRFDAVGFPITPKRLLFLAHRDNHHNLEVRRSIHYLKIQSDKVFEMNECSTFNSMNNIFCPNQEYLDEFTTEFRKRHKF